MITGEIVVSNLGYSRFAGCRRTMAMLLAGASLTASLVSAAQAQQAPPLAGAPTQTPTQTTPPGPA